jgi:membrane-associated phospholipid phosphatase
MPGKLFVHRRRAVRRVLDAAPAALTPPQWRPLAYAAALLFGVAMGALRMAGGAHFFTDGVFAGVLMFLVV